MKNKLLFSGILVCVFFIPTLNAQSIAQVEEKINLQVAHPNLPLVKKLKVAIITSLYLDTFYDKNTLKLQSKNIDKFLKNGWDFYIGSKLAIDSLKQTRQIDNNVIWDIECYYYDLKDIVDVKNGYPILKDTFSLIPYDLIIGTPLKTEMSLLAEFAKNNNIPFVSVIFPSPLQNKDNNNLILLNPTLSTYIKEMIKYLHKQSPTQVVKILVKNEEANGVLSEYISEIENGFFAKKNILQVQRLENNFRIEEVLKSKISPKVAYAFFVLSLNLEFANNFLNQLTNKYPSTDYNFFVGGMPNWEQGDFIQKWNKENLKIFYAKSHIHFNSEFKHETIRRYYKENFYGLPSDMFWLGYDVTYNFIKRMMFAQNNNRVFYNNLNDPSQNIFLKYRFYSKDILISNQGTPTSFIENQHFYFIQNCNGVNKISEN